MGEKVGRTGRKREREIQRLDRGQIEKENKRDTEGKRGREGERDRNKTREDRNDKIAAR